MVGTISDQAGLPQARSGKLCWLHLSDIHFLPTTEWRDATVRDNLLDYVKKQLQDQQLQVDLIFCTGDIAFGALKDRPLSGQYAMAREFFDRVLTLCGCDKTRLFVVPGNHDIDRGRIFEAVQTSWTAWGEDGKAASMLSKIHTWFANYDKDAKEALCRLEAWGVFVADYLPHQNNAAAGHYHHAQVLDINGIKVGVAGFNSAWTCAGDEDDRKIWLAAGPQFDFMRKQLNQPTNQAEVKIGLIHHPWDWFNVAERMTIKQRIGDEAHFWLHGHTHDAWVQEQPSHITLGAGAVTSHTEPEFGCNLVQLDLATGHGQAHLYRYNQRKARWVKDTEDTPAEDGLWPFALPKDIGKRRANRLADSTAAVSRPDSEPPSGAKSGSQAKEKTVLDKLLGMIKDAFLDSRAADFKRQLGSELGLSPDVASEKFVATLEALPDLSQQMFKVQKAMLGLRILPNADEEQHPVERAARALYMHAAVNAVDLAAWQPGGSRPQGVSDVPEKCEVAIAVLMAAVQGEIHQFKLLDQAETTGGGQPKGQALLDLDGLPFDPFRDQVAIVNEMATRVDKLHKPETIADIAKDAKLWEKFLRRQKLLIEQQRSVFSNYFRFVGSEDKQVSLKNDANCAELYKILGVPLTRISASGTVEFDLILGISADELEELFRMLLELLNDLRKI
jgi:predicted phosphodiesterase